MNNPLSKAKAYIFAVISNLSYVVMTMIVKILSHQLSAQMILMMRSTFLLLLNSVFIQCSPDYAAYYTELVPSDQQYFTVDIKRRENFLAMMKRQFWTTLTVFCMFSSLKYVQLSVAQSLYNLGPIFIFFVEAIFYKKPFKRGHFILTVISFSGVLLIIQPFSASSDFNLHYMLPIIAAVASAISFIYLHELRGKFKQIVVLQYAYSTQMITSSLLMQVFQQRKGTDEAQNFPIAGVALLFILIVVLAYSSNFFRIKSMFLKKPSEVLPLNYIGVILSLILDSMMFQKSINIMKGVGVILASIGLISKLLIDFINRPKTSLH